MPTRLRHDRSDEGLRALATDHQERSMAHFSEYKKKDGTIVYRVRVVTGYQKDGKPIQESRSYATKTEAKKAAKAWETEITKASAGPRQRPRWAST